MEEVPNIISNKDLLLIRDVLIKENLFCKKINLFNDIAIDNDIKNYLDKVYKRHKDNIINILKLLY